jgi:hypothetical protein
MLDLAFSLGARRYTTKTSSSVCGISLLVRTSVKELDREEEEGIMKATNETYVILLGFTTVSSIYHFIAQYLTNKQT